MFFEEFLRFIGYRVTSGERYYWECFGKNARYIESDEVSDKGFIRASAIFDTETKIIYQLESTDDRESVGYRWMHPSYRNAYLNEAIQRGVNPYNLYDDVEFSVCETVDEWNEKTLELLKEKEPEEYDDPMDERFNFAKDDLQFSLTDFYTRFYDSNGEDIEVQVKRYIDELYGVQK